MRVVMVEPRDTGGMVHYAYHLCTAMAEAGAQVTLVTGPGYELTGYPHNFTVSPTWRPHAPQRSARTAAAPGPLGAVTRRARRLARLSRSTGLLMREWWTQSSRLRDDAPDWVLFGSIEHFIEGPFLARLRRSGVRLASIVHEPESRAPGRALARAIDRRAFRFVFAQFAALFTHNDSNRRRLLELFPGIEPSRVYAIEHGNNLLLPPGGPADVDLRARYGLPADAPVVLFFGTMSPSKGITDLIEAFALAAARHPEARLVVTGHPGRHVEPGDYVRMAADLGIGDRVTVAPGYVPLEEVEPHMALADVVAFPYRSATQSGALQVAYAFGKPVVATRVGGLPEVVEDGGSGYLVPPQDPPALAAALGRMLDDLDAARAMGAHAKHLSETKHSWAHVAETILGAFGDPAHSSPAGHPDRVAGA